MNLAASKVAATTATAPQYLATETETVPLYFFLYFLVKEMTEKCSIDGCFDLRYSKGWCAHHYYTNWKYGDPLQPGVERRERTCGCYPPGSTCRIPECGNKILAKDLCRKHYMRNYNHGDPTIVLRGPNGAGSVKRGYVYFSIGGREGKTVLAHRYIMEQSLGRPLLSGETVHHKNGIRSDNRLVKGHELHCPSTCCNLELWNGSQPSGQRARDKLAWAREIIRAYNDSDEEATIASE